MALIWASFVLLPLIEIAVFIQVGHGIGLGGTLALVVLAGIAGISLIRLQGLATLRRAQACLERQEVPATELFDAACGLLAGVLLLIPGFVTDALALLLLIPAVRSGLRRWLWIRFSARRPGAGPTARRDHPSVIDADFTVVDAPKRSRSPWERPQANGTAP